ncbi:galactokinase [Haloglycomyces albus]|uniref:galactokinase n=1 Tax=Haloglycomyces albus TaxID=526067 RepID=UPI00046C8FB3|nr:galactokinase [Haloglycomyces albus]
MTTSQPHHEYVSELHRRIYGSEAKTLAAAPGRANLIGEHVDYCDGLVMPFAIDRYSHVTASASPQWHIYSTAHADDGVISGNDHPDWTRYVHGVQSSLADWGYHCGAAQVVIDSHVPPGAGLSSSAALTCSVLRALIALYDLDVPVNEQIEIAQRVETHYVGMPCGPLDQSASLLSRFGHILLYDCRDRSVDYIPFDPPSHGLELMLIDTRAPHRLVDAEYADRRHSAEDAARRLGIPSLRSARSEAWKDIADPIVSRRARHVVTELERVHATIAALRAEDFSTVGSLLNAAHDSLRDDYEVSSIELDSAQEAAHRAGALGARMIGGGFGGSVIALVPADRSDHVAASVSEAAGERGLPEPDIMTAAPAHGSLHLSTT